tara:strand:+ start:757 stop:2025 length:1269 start_codon:yes stop_codon:yes gene_type:complete
LKYLGSLKKSLWTLTEIGIAPFTVLIATPFLLKFLGVDIFAQYIFAKTIVSMGSLVSMTMNEAVTKEIAINPNNKEKKHILNSIKASITITTISIFIILIIFLPIFWRFFPLFFIKIGDQKTLHLILIFALFLIYCEQIDGIFSGALKGLENFKQSALLELIARAINLSLCLYISYKYKDLYKLLEILLFSSLLRIFLKVVILSRLIRGFTFIFGWDKKIFFNLLNFGKWNWLQLIGGSLEENGNRLLLASMVGPEALTIYSISNTLTRTVHLIPFSCLYWIFPKASKLSTNNKYIPRNFLKKSISANIIISLPLGFLLLILGKHILSLWISPEFASENYLFFILISIYWIIYSFYPSSYFLLLGFGKQKLLGLIDIFGCLVSIIFSYIGINIFGIYGIFIGKYLSAIISFKQIQSANKLSD